MWVFFGKKKIWFELVDECDLKDYLVRINEFNIRFKVIKGNLLWLILVRKLRKVC